MKCVRIYTEKGLRLESARKWVTSIHRESEKGHCRRAAHLVYAAPCMNIRPTLQTTASPSDGSVDLLSCEGKMLQRMAAGRMRESSCP